MDVVALARELARDQRMDEAALAAAEYAARELAGSWPQLDQIERCYTSPGDGCLCEGGDFTHYGDPQPVPAWVSEAKEIKLAAEETLEAIALVMGSPDGVLALSDGQQQSTGQWLAGLYRSNHAEFLQTYEVLAHDNSPQSAEAIAEARQIVFGNQPQPSGPAPLPGGAMAHTMAAAHNRRHTLGALRRGLGVEGTKGRQHVTDTIGGSHPQLPPPPEPEQEDKPRRKRGYRLR